MERSVLLAVLARCAVMEDKEEGHFIADSALLEYINDAEIEAAYMRIDKWYA